MILTSAGFVRGFARAVLLVTLVWLVPVPAHAGPFQASRPDTLRFDPVTGEPLAPAPAPAFDPLTGLPVEAQPEVEPAPEPVSPAPARSVPAAEPTPKPPAGKSALSSFTSVMRRARLDARTYHERTIWVLGGGTLIGAGGLAGGLLGAVVTESGIGFLGGAALGALGTMELLARSRVAVPVPQQWQADAQLRQRYEAAYRQQMQSLRRRSMGAGVLIVPVAFFGAILIIGSLIF